MEMDPMTDEIVFTLLLWWASITSLIAFFMWCRANYWKDEAEYYRKRYIEVDDSRWHCLGERNWHVDENKKLQKQLSESRETINAIHGKCELYQFTLTENDEPETE